MAKLLLVICALIALSAAAEDIFYSEKYIPEPVHVQSAFIHNGSYFPKLDHFRPQDTRTAHFVRRQLFSADSKVLRFLIESNFLLVSH